MRFFQQKILIPLALVLSLFTTVLVMRFIQKQQEAAQKPKVVLTSAVVATMDLAPGTKITPQNLKVAEFPAELVPMGAFSDPAVLTDRVVKTSIFTGEIILEGKLAPLGSSGGVSGLIPLGMRAMSVAIDPVSGVSGFIFPNSRVDVLVTVSSSMEKEAAATKIILEDVLVLAIDQRFGQSGGEAPAEGQHATLLVTPEQAEKLALAETEGRIRLALRNSADHDQASTPGVRLGQLMPAGYFASSSGSLKTSEPSSPPAAKPPVTSTSPSAKQSSSNTSAKVEPVITGKTVEILYANKRERITFGAD